MVFANWVQRKMWSEPDGMFLNIDARTGKFVHIKSWTSFTPLWAGIAMPEQAQRTITSHLLNPKEFWAPCGIRTLAADEPGYDPDHGYWRGPIWVVSNYQIMHGLMNYGFAKEARELAGKTVTMLVNDYATTGGMNECYTPETGKPTAGGHFLSWNLLAEHMIDEAGKRNRPDRHSGAVGKPLFNVVHLRGKPGTNHAQPEHLITEPGVGCRLIEKT